jgi:uncharacterized protein YecE (DUF72 family)
MATVYAGTSGWAYTTWKPKFYPAKLASAKFLSYYATRLNTVEVNYTFRHIATQKTQQGWIEQTPATFKFSIKANQRLTHIKRLRDAADDARSFFATLQPLAETNKLGMVLFQLPPFLKADGGLLRDFLAGVPRAGRVAFEFRHVSWFDETVFAILREHRAAICVAETEDLETPDIATADFVYYRLRKPEYSPAERKSIAEKVSKHIEASRDVFVYFKHEDTPEGALYAEELLTTFAGTAAQAAV